MNTNNIIKVLIISVILSIIGIFIVLFIGFDYCPSFIGDNPVIYNILLWSSRIFALTGLILNVWTIYISKDDWGKLDGKIIICFIISAIALLLTTSTMTMATLP